jgi:hypothetical protein
MINSAIRDISKPETEKSIKNYYQNIDSYYRAGVFKDSIKMKVKKHRRVETDTSIIQNKGISRYRDAVDEFRPWEKQQP